MGTTFTSVNPARPAEILGTYAEATAEDVDAGVTRATDARRESGRGS
jgi:acyl-CoA reductase-like NAD-dependent aldehyde dehydrogenase